MAQSSSKNAVIINSIIGSIQIITGYILTVFFSFAVIGAMVSFFQTHENATAVFFSFGLAVLSVFLIIRGKKRKNLIKLFKEYALRFSIDPLHSIDRLAADTGAASDTVKTNITKMLRKGYFVNAFIDNENNRLVFVHNSSALLQQKSDGQRSSLSIEFVAVSCPGCGAVNKVEKGVVSKCEYCGNTLMAG